VFLFDEPLSNLDAQLRIVMRGEIKALHQKLKTTTIYVTHDQVEAMTMADTVVVLNAGRVEQAGPPLELYDHPANQFVAGFIGSPAMNFIAGAITADRFATSTGALLPLPQNAHRFPQGPAIYGVRPEHLALSTDGGVPAEVRLVEPMGSETQVTVQLGGTRVVCMLRERVALTPGSTVHLRPRVDSVHLFDAGRGKRLGT